MCLLVFAWQAHPRYRLIIAANRDEFHDRPAAALGWWSDDPRVLAGRDLRAGGTWMGVARSGRFGVVTNFRELERPAGDAPSRGDLIPAFLKGSVPPRAYLEELGPRAARYAGLNLVLGNAHALYYFSNRNGLAPRKLEAGIYGLSNHWLDSPWPKLRRVRARLMELMTANRVEADALFALLADRTPAELGEMPDTGLPAEWELALSSPFVVHERYGTRCSTVLLVEHDGRTTICERRFDAQSAFTGATRLEFVSEGEPSARSLPATHP